MSVYDEIAEKIGDDEWDKWKKEVLNTKDEIAHFVTHYRPGSQDPEVIDWIGGCSIFVCELCSAMGARMP